jgi:hypothetical protein
VAEVRISENLMERLRSYADQTGQTVDQVVENLIFKLLGHSAESVSAEVDYSNDPLLELSGIANSGETDLSERTNEILREEVDPKRGWTFNKSSDS